MSANSDEVLSENAGLGHSGPGTVAVEKSFPILATSPTKMIPATTFPLKSYSPGYGSTNITKRRTTKRLSSRNIGQAARLDLKSSSNLGVKLLGDIIVGTSVTLGVTPFLTIIDKAIVQRAAGTHTTAQSGLETLRIMTRNPVAYMKSPAFLLMWGVYAATYSTANSLKTISEHQQHASSMEKDKNGGRNLSTMGVFLGTSITNSGLSLLKDKAYAKMFGTGGMATKVPLISYGLWASRDFMVVGSSFIMPEKVSTAISQQAGLSKTDSLRIAQIVCPVATQLIAGPVQLLGLDFYNRPLSHMSFSEAAAERVAFLWRGAASIIGARVARIAPGYGIGGIGNTYFRESWREMLILQEMKTLAELELEDDQNESASRLVELVTQRDLEAKRAEKLVAATYKV